MPFNECEHNHDEELIDVTLLELNGKDFVVIAEIEYNDVNYLYAVSDDEDEEVVLLRESIEDGEEYIESVEDENEYNEILDLLESEMEESDEDEETELHEEDDEDENVELY